MDGAGSASSCGSGWGSSSGSGSRLGSTTSWRPRPRLAPLPLLCRLVFSCSLPGGFHRCQELGIGWKTFPPALRLLFWPQTVTTTQSILAEALALLPSPAQQHPLATPGGRILGTTFFPRLTLGFLVTQTTTYVTHHPSLPINTCTDLQQLPPGGHLSPLKIDGAWLSCVPVQRWRGWAAMPGLGLSAPRE